jgi:hypothetical protein
MQAAVTKNFINTCVSIMLQYITCTNKQEKAECSFRLSDVKVPSHEMMLE